MLTLVSSVNPNPTLIKLGALLGLGLKSAFEKIKSKTTLIKQQIGMRSLELFWPCLLCNLWNVPGSGLSN